MAADVRQNYLNEVTSATGSVFLGLTIGCARCHDHKYDPIPHARLLSPAGVLQRHPSRTDVDVPYKDKAFAAQGRGEDPGIRGAD